MPALGDAAGDIRFDAPKFPGQQGKEDYMLVTNRTALLVASRSPYHKRPNGNTLEVKLPPRLSLRGQTSQTCCELVIAPDSGWLR
jgi:hypothetical protein